jgi:uncharacterized phage protein (TIGR01671 family)
MREILFKAKSEETNQWKFGNLLQFEDGSCRIREKEWSDNGYHTYVVIPETVCQFTGLTDKNGVKIFEGDFDKDGNMVVWCDRCNGWQFAQIDVPTKDICIPCHWCDGNFDFSEHIDDFVISGNIHDIKL